MGRKLGLDPISLGIIRVGGSFEGNIDGRVANFRFLLNGPQIILFVGGIIILFAGLYGQRAFHRYFGWHIHDKIIQRRPKVGETAWDPGADEVCEEVEQTSSGTAGAAEAVQEEMAYLGEAELSLQEELTGGSTQGTGLHEEIETVEAGGDDPGREEDETR